MGSFFLSGKLTLAGKIKYLLQFVDHCFVCPAPGRRAVVQLCESQCLHQQLGGFLSEEL